MDKAKRTSKVIDAELEAERSTIKKLRSKLETAKAEATKTEQAQDRAAYQALAHDDKGAQKRLDDAEERLAKAERHIRSFEKAIAQGVLRFEALEAEWKAALADEAWAALMADAELALKEAQEIDKHVSAMAELLGVHGGRLENLKRQAHALGFERVFQTVGLRHFDRIFAWKMIQAGFAGEYEKPSEQYRKAAGYAEILGMQIEAAKNIHTNMEQAGRDGGGPGAEGNGEAAMEPGTETEAGATATYIQVRPDDPEAPLPGQVWLKSGAQ